jgi:hypothetical protein
MKTGFLRYSVFIFFIGLFANSVSFAQEIDVSNYRMYFKFNTTKQPDNSRLLEVNFTGVNKKDRKDKIPVFEAEIKFYNVLEDEEVLLGSAKTSKEGTAQLVLPENQDYLIDEDGNIVLKARFDATDAMDEEENELTFKDIFLDLNLEVIDSVKTVLVKAFVVDSIGTKTPVEESEIKLYIQGMLSKFKIKEGTLSDGEFEFPFETKVPGDKDGNITVLAMIEDSDDFGNVIQKKTIDWGVLNKKVAAQEHKLWSKVAPIWMYVVLSVLLLGVWANYIYTIINLFKISKSKIQKK